MPSMYSSCPFIDFSTEDVEKFEKYVNDWHRYVHYEKPCGTPVILFDENEFAFRDKAKNKKIEEVPQGEKAARVTDVYEVVLKLYTFTYIRPYGNMCIMYSIRENQTQSVIYHMPLQWNNAEPWLAAGTHQ